MKITKKVSVAGQYAKLGTDFDEGDNITILNGGDITTGQYGEQHTFKVNTKNGERNMSFNQTTLNYLIDAYGDDTEAWAGKEVKVWVVDMNVQGKMRAVAFLTAPDWKKTRVNGELRFVPTNQEPMSEVDEDIAPENIPF
jgi:hypothetical protein